MITETENKLIQALKSPRGPRLFFDEILGETLDEQQIPIVEGFHGDRRIAVKSGHSCGKDFLAARLALYFHVTNYPSITITTGPTDRQVRHVVWGEIRAAYKRAAERALEGRGIPIGGELLPDSPMLKTGDPDHILMGFTAKTPEAIQGFHKRNVFIVVTEAPGVEPRMWPAIESLMTANNAKLMIIGNATYEPDSEFYAAFAHKAAIYTPYTLDSQKSSYCSQAYIDEVREVHGEDSAYWKARVKGEFPDDVSDNLIPLAWIEAAMDKWSYGTWELTHPTSLGVDVARFGSDLTVEYEGRKTHYKCVHFRQGQDTMETAGRVVVHIRDGKIPADCVQIDDTGVGGGVTDRVKEQRYMIQAINFGAGSTVPEKYPNTRCEIFWSLREKFRCREIAIDPKDRKLVRDLSALKYKIDSKGRITLEPKMDAKKRLGYSPDRADALALAALPKLTAMRLGQGNKPSWGLLEMARQAMGEEETKKDKSIKDSAVSQRPMTEVAGAQEVLDAGKQKRDYGQPFNEASQTRR